MCAIVIEVLAIFSLILINGVFALAEIAVVASRRSRLQRLADKGNPQAKVALQLAQSPADFLSTVQVGITLIGVLSGAFAGATIAEQLAHRLADFSAIAPYAEAIALAVVVLAITYLSLIVGELVPKRIALNNPERIGSLIAGPMRLLSKITLPIVRVLSLSTDAVLWVLRVRSSAEPSITEEEVRILIRQGTVAGGFEKAKKEMVERVFRLSSLGVSAIMTPRRHIVALFTTDTAEAITEKLKAGRHSHYPLCDASLDNVLGIVSTTDLLWDPLAGRRIDLRSHVRDVPSIPESVSALKALELLKRSESRVGFVIDEFGGLQGIVTMSNIAGAIVGLVPQLKTPEIITRKDGSLLVDGLLPIDDLQEVIRLSELATGKSQSYSTVGGFVLARIGRIPLAGDTFDAGEYRIEVLDMDGLRVDKVLVRRIKPLQPK